MTFGFVYVLANAAMPGIVKIGCTERSPHERAAELSKASGVPVAFSVVCYIEVRDCQAVERDFHNSLEQAGGRLSPFREFFRIPEMHKLIGLFYYAPEAVAFCAPDKTMWSEFIERGSFNPYRSAQGADPAFEKFVNACGGHGGLV